MKKVREQCGRKEAVRRSKASNLCNFSCDSKKNNRYYAIDIREYELLGQWAFINLAANNRLNVPSLCTEHKTNKKRIMQERADKTAEKTVFLVCVCATSSESNAEQWTGEECDYNSNYRCGWERNGKVERHQRDSEKEGEQRGMICIKLSARALEWKVCSQNRELAAHIAKPEGNGIRLHIPFLMSALTHTINTFYKRNIRVDVFLLMLVCHRNLSLRWGRRTAQRTIA